MLPTTSSSSSSSSSDSSDSDSDDSDSDGSESQAASAAVPRPRASGVKADRPENGKWGSFVWSLTPLDGNSYAKFTVRCQHPLHNKNKHCTRTRTWRTRRQRGRVISQLKAWCVRADEFESRQAHMACTIDDDAADLPVHFAYATYFPQCS